VGAPKQVASEIVARFGDEVDRIAFYTPYALSPGTLGELVDAIGGNHKDGTT
jgi:hypothetical protein